MRSGWALHLPFHVPKKRLNIGPPRPQKASVPRQNIQFIRPGKKNRASNPFRVPTDYSHPVRTQIPKCHLKSGPSDHCDACCRGKMDKMPSYAHQQTPSRVGHWSFDIYTVGLGHVHGGQRYVMGFILLHVGATVDTTVPWFNHSGGVQLADT